jgi:hypothetical protein
MIDLTLIPTNPMVDDHDQLVMFEIPCRVCLDGSTGRACWHCGVDRNEYPYMVHRDVWLQATSERHGPILCVGCIEALLGRELCHDDFNWAVPLTHDVGSPRLEDRKRARGDR